MSGFTFTVLRTHYFRPDRLSRLSSLFPGVPLMALTATAPPSVRDEILTITPRAFLTQASVNQANLTFRVMKLDKGTKGDHTVCVCELTWCCGS